MLPPLRAAAAAMAAASGPAGSVAPAVSTCLTTSGSRGAKRMICDRERIVGSWRSSAVPTRIITAPSGGSSSVFSRQLAPSSAR